jgi:hypothetical protein
LELKMSSGATAAAAAAAAAEAERRREEEEMTNYADADVQGEWEFKIVRSNTAKFKNPEALRQVCDEEARAGWTLLEKFDNQRLRFKRPISARSGDAGLDFDPYRTQYGVSPGALAATIVAFGILLAIALFVVIVLFVKK